MVECLLSLWNKITKRKQPIDPELLEKLEKLKVFLNEKNDDETFLLGLSICLEELPKEILEYQPLLEGRHHSGYLINYGMEGSSFIVKELIDFALDNKKLIRGSLIINEGREKHLFLWNTILTLNSVLNAWCKGK